MEFQILGPLEVVAGGQNLRLGGPKRRALLALLLTHANRVVSVDRLRDGLWGGAPPDGAAANIQVYVSQLRKQLEPNRKPTAPYEILVSQPPGYVLRVDPDQLDLYRFEQLKDAGTSALTAGDAEVAAASLRQALDLWRGPALAEFAAETWALGEAGRMNEMRLQAVELRIDADLALGRHTDLIAELEPLVAEHPLRERLRGQLMVALYRSGRQGEASDVFQRTREKLVEELGMEPGPGLQKLLKQILKQDPELTLPTPTPRPPPPPPGRLPTPLTRLIGREAELKEVQGLVSSSRLVSLLGVGGVGKTRLAIEVGSRLARDFDDGVRYVDLAALSTPDLLPQAVVNALGLRDQSNEDITQVIVNHLVSRQVLVVLDNCEHVAETSARLVDTVLQQCPKLRVLATTRETLGIRGESVYRLDGLSLADTQSSDESAAPSDAVTLFLDRAHAAASSFRPTPEQLRAISQICARLDGLPLAIELAAASLTVMSPREILNRLDRRLDPLTSGPRTVGERQRTLAATIDWSYRLLNHPEQRLFRRMSVFRGWFGVDAIGEICSVAGEPNSASTDILARLVNKSMAIPGIADKLGRCRMLETVREFASNRLERAGEVKTITRRHAEHYLTVVERAAPYLRTPDQRRWIVWVGEEYDNIRVALDWALANDSTRGLQMAAALENFWFHGRQNEGRFWLSRTLQATQGAGGGARANALYVASWLCWMQGDYASAQRTAEELIAISTRAGDQFNRGRGRRYMALLAYSREDRDLASKYFAEALPDLRTAGTPWELAIALNDYSLLLHDFGRTEDAQVALEEGVALAKEAADPWLLGLVTDTVATFAMLRGNVREARRLWHECLQMADQVGDQWTATFIVDGLASVALQDGQAERALCLLGASSALRASMGATPTPLVQRAVDEVDAESRARLDPQGAEAARERGRRLSWADLVDYALSG
jgi:predicted ATPase/DNA-binding SARP family transcriptional activator